MNKLLAFFSLAASYLKIYSPCPIWKTENATEFARHLVLDKIVFFLGLFTDKTAKEAFFRPLKLIKLRKNYSFIWSSMQCEELSKDTLEKRSPHGDNLYIAMAPISFDRCVPRCFVISFSPNCNCLIQNIWKYRKRCIPLSPYRIEKHWVFQYFLTVFRNGKKISLSQVPLFEHELTTCAILCSIFYHQIMSFCCRKLVVCGRNLVYDW